VAAADAGDAEAGDPREGGRTYAELLSPHEDQHLLGSRNHLRPHRIEMNIADEFREICLALAQDRFVPSLQHMADPTIFAVVILSVARQNAVHDPANIVGHSLDQQMNMIRHQTIGVEKEWQLAFLRRQERNKFVMILGGVENILAIDATRDQMIKAALNLKPLLSRHNFKECSTRPAGRSKNRNKVGLTPISSIGDVVGPAWVCPNIARPDVVAMREMAIRAAKGAKFVPAMRDGAPFASNAKLDLVFTDPNPKKKDDVVGAEIGVKGANTGGTVASGDEPPPPPPPKKMPDMISGGVLNGKATNLARPAYPPAATTVNASGAVNVHVVIDHDGNVFSAQAFSGHPLLKAASERAACSSTFSPTLLDGIPVRVTGVITYNFVP
jgi:hypothetical protein